MFKIITAVVLMPTELDAEENHRYIILVKLSERKLYLFEGDKKVKFYPIAIPKYNYYRSLSGELVKVEINPVWYPTKETRAEYLRKKGIELPQAVGPFNRDRRNAMGKAKFIVEFEGFIDQTIRIHGTNDPDSIGKKISRGCIRMYNEDILELAEIVKNAKAKILIND